MDCSAPGSSVRGIFQARVLEWGTIVFSVWQLREAQRWWWLFSHSVVSNYLLPWPASRQAPLSYTISLSLIKLMSIELVMLSNHLTLCCPLLLLPSIFCIWVLCNESAIRIRWPKYCSFSIRPSSEYSEFISFRIGGFVLLAVQGILKAHL